MPTGCTINMVEKTVLSVGESFRASSSSGSETTIRPTHATQSTEEDADEYGFAIHASLGCDRCAAPKSSYQSNTFELDSSVQRHAEQFLEVMGDQLVKAKDFDTRSIDLRAKHSWSETMKAAENAQSAYERAGFSLWRKAGRGLSTRSEIAQPFLRLIPNDFFASILYGGLRLVFEALSQVDERRSEILRAFLRIPDIIVLAEDCVQNFPSDDQLYRRAEIVFCSALPAIEETTRWLKQNPAAKHIRALFLGPSYNKSFKQKLQTLDEALTSLQERVSVLRDGSIKKIGEVVDNVQNGLKRTGTMVSAVSEDIERISRSQNETRAKMDDFHTFEQIRDQAREAIRIALEQKVLTSQWMKVKDRVISRLKRQIEAVEQGQVGLTENDLLEILDVSADLAGYDVRQAHRACRSVALEEIEATQSIIHGDKMAQWFSEDAAAALLIEAESTDFSSRNTPLSFLCAEMIETFRDKEPAVSIHFFCGMHTSPYNALRGPCGVMRSLISQVVRLFPPKLDFMSRRYRQNLEALQLHTLCDCFCRLVRKLPIDTVVVCIIDGISFLETREWASSCRELVGHLQSLLEEEDDNVPVFKLLLTSPTRSRYVADALGDDCRIVLPSNNFTNVRHGPTDRELAMTGTRPKTSSAVRPESLPGSRKRKRFRFSMSMRETETIQSGSDSECSSERVRTVLEKYTCADMDVDVNDRDAN